MEFLSQPNVDKLNDRGHEAFLASRQASKLQHMPPTTGRTAYQRLRAEYQAEEAARRHADAGRSPPAETCHEPKTANQNWSVLLDPFISAKRAERMEKLMLEAAQAEHEEQLAYQELCDLGGAARNERECLAPLSMLPRAVDKPGALRETNRLSPVLEKKQYVAGTAKARYAAIWSAIQ